MEIIFDDKCTNLTDVLAAVRPLANEYQQWNSWDRSDGLIIHTDAIQDFIEWLELKATNVRLE